MAIAKIGRNDPCPCGSGKKYKKCCIDQGEEVFANQSGVLTYEEVNDLDTEAIIQQLVNMGIPFNKKEFLQEIETAYSAEQISENWFRQYKVKAWGREEDFPWLAAWILWERLAPAHIVSLEQLDDLIELGNQYMERRDSFSACDTWLKAWDGLKYRVNRRYKDLAYLEKQYEGTFFVSNLCQDLEVGLEHAGLKEPIYFEKRIKFCREFLDFFPEEGGLMELNMRRAIAESYAYIGKQDESEREFQQMVQDYPSSPWGYIGWGDMYFTVYEEKDYEKALELYEKGMEIADDEDDISVLEDRIEDVKKFKVR